MKIGIKPAGAGYYKVSAIIRSEDLRLVMAALKVGQILFRSIGERVSKNPTVANGQVLVAMSQEFLASYPQQYAELLETEKLVQFPSETEEKAA